MKQTIHLTENDIKQLVMEMVSEICSNPDNCVESIDFNTLQNILNKFGLSIVNTREVENPQTGQSGTRYEIEWKDIDKDELENALKDAANDPNGVIVSVGQHRYAPEIKRLSVVVLDNDYDGGKYDTYADDTMYESVKNKRNTQKNMNLTNEALKKYLKRMIMEEVSQMGNRQYVIQTKTGGYLMDIVNDETIYDEQNMIVYARVGKSNVAITVDKDDYQELISNGTACDGMYTIYNGMQDETPEMPCSISVYNG